MATQNPNIPVPAGLPDMSKINYVGVTPDEAENIQGVTEKYLQDLENRYAQPNWWKVAAGFAKPQLGGFMASLGSAADALGENIEQQRAIAPTISMMRAQLAQQQPGIRQAQKAASLAAGRTGPVTEDYVRQLEELGDTPAARAARKSYDSQQAEQGLRSKQMENAMALANAQLQSGALDKAGYAREIARITGMYGPPPKPEMPVDANAVGKPAGTVTTPPPSAAAEAPKWTGTDLSPTFLKQLQQKADAGDPTSKEILQSYNAAHGVGKAPAAAPVTTYESAGATGPAASELTKEELARRDSDLKGKISKIATATPDVTELRASDFARAGTLLNDPSVQSAMAQRFKDPGFTTAFKEALAKGFTAAVAGGGAGWSANVSAPVDAVLTAYNVDPKTRAKLIELNRIAMRDSIADLREGTQALGGGHASTTEYQGLMNRVANTEEPYKLMQQWFATRAAQNQFDREAHNAYQDYLHQPKSGERPLSSFFQHPGYVDAVKNLGKNYRKAQSVAD